MLSPLCCLSMGLSTFGDLLLKLCNISGFRMQVTVLASAYKTSGCLYLRALFRKRRALSVHRKGWHSRCSAPISRSAPSAALRPHGSQSSLSVSRLNAEPAEHQTSLTPQGTTSSGTAAGISQRELSTSSPRDGG